MSTPLTRRAMLRNAAAGAAALVLPGMLTGRANRGAAARPADPDCERLLAWTAALRNGGLARAAGSIGGSAVRVGELAAGTPYEPSTLEAYLRAGGSPSGREPLTLSLTHFDCVTLVESCLAVARVAGEQGAPTWERFGREIERMRYRGGERRGYTSRLHYFSEWITDGAKRGLVRDLGAELGGVEDAAPAPLHDRGIARAIRPSPTSGVFREIGATERRLDGRPRRVIPTARIPEVADRIESGDVLAFATAIPGLDVTHAAFAYRDARGRPPRAPRAAFGRRGGDHPGDPPRVRRRHSPRHRHPGGATGLRLRRS